MPGSAGRLFLHTSIAISLILIIVIIIIIIFTIIAISVIIEFVFILHWKTLWSFCLFCSFRISWHMLFSYLALFWPSVVCHLPHQHFGIFAYFARLWNPDTGYLYIWPCWDHRWRVIVHINTFFVDMCIVVFLSLCLYSYLYLYMYMYGLVVTISGVSLSTSAYSLLLCVLLYFCICVCIRIHICICIFLDLWPSVACHCPHQHILCSDWQKHRFFHNHTCLNLF